MKISNLKIHLQLRTAFGIILFLILILGATAWMQSQRIAVQTTDLYEHPLKIRRAIGDLTSSIYSIRLEYRNMLLAKTERDRKNAVTNIALARNSAEQSMNVINDRYLSEKNDVVDVQQSFLKWVLLVERNRDMILNGNIQEALKSLDDSSDFGRERENLLANLDKVDRTSKMKADELYQNSLDLKRQLDTQLVLLFAIIFVSSFIVLLILVRNIVNPISLLTETTRQFGEGNYKIRNRYDSRNEFGVLSSSFNELATTIENELDFKDRSAHLNSIMLEGFESKDFVLQLLEPLMRLTNSQVSAIFLLNEQKTHYEHFESIGLKSGQSKSFSAIDLEGEFGKALVSKKIEHITNISTNTYTDFDSVSGLFQPKEIITIPLLNKQEVIAFVSLSSLNVYDKIAIRLVNDMQGALTAWINAMLAGVRVKKMSVDLKIQNQELESQKRELSSQATELSEQNFELEMQKRQLAESSQMKSNFLSNMSHELRTPLNSVIALSGVLNRRLLDKIPSEEYSYLDVIERNGKLLLALINDILDLSRIEAGFEEFIPSRFNINELLTDIVELIEPQIKQKNIGLSLKTVDSPPWIRSDYEKCRHILQNIVANAIKFTEKGEVVITVSSDDQSMRIEIMDTGIGIAKENQSHIFEEFRQADNSNSRKYGGTGLGLSIAKKYAEFLGGGITVTSEPGKGSTFTLNLPIEPPIPVVTEVIEDVTPVKVQTCDWSTITEQEKSSKTILIVEDSPVIVMQLTEILSSEGFSCMVARSGNEAFERISEKIPDAMILDLMMPEVDGFEVLKSIREIDVTSHLPVVILTAKYVTKDELSFLKSNHIHQLIQKGDINKDQLIDAVFKMTFPVKEAVVASQEPRVSLVKNPGQRTILIVEDNPDNMLTIKVLLNDVGTIIEATDGPEGLEMAIRHTPDLILMDIALPRMNGIETLKEIRKVDYLKSIPVIALSASAMKGDREQFLASGFNDYVSKPIDNEILFRVLNKFMPS